MSKRAFVFIDGGNFYFKLKKLSSALKGKYSLINFDFKKFSEWLTIPNKLIEIHYYLGAIKREHNNSKSEKFYADQQKLIGKLHQQKINVTMGQIIRHPDKTYHEKGVDVRLAVEMIKFARMGKYDIAYLISSDTDLVPAVEEIKAFNKEVHYIGISKGQSYGLSNIADEIRLLRAEEIKKFLPKLIV